jgi:hypothetical protein
MAGELNTEFPSWLAAQYAPRAQSSWMLQALQQGMQREEMRQKLPLELQGMALQNQAHKLAIEHQGIVNNLQNQEMMDFAQDLPIYRSALEVANKTPGGAISMPTPQFRSKKALDLWQERQKADAQTAYGQAIHQSTIDDYKAVTEAIQITGDKLLPGANGQFDPDAKAALLNKARGMKRQEGVADAVTKAQQTDPLALHAAKLKATREAYETALAGGDPAVIAKAKADYEDVQALTVPSGETFETFDAEGHLINRVTRGKSALAAAPDQLTVAGKTAAQAQQARALETIDTASRLMPLISEETVGAQAFAESWVKDRILAQKFPEMASGDRAKASQLISKMRADVVKNFKSDGNIAKDERNEILASFPKANDPIDSPARAKMVVQQAQVMAAVQVLAATKRLGGEVPGAAAAILDDEAVVDMVKRRIIDPELAQKIWKMKRQ